MTKLAFVLGALLAGTACGNSEVPDRITYEGNGPPSHGGSSGAGGGASAGTSSGGSYDGSGGSAIIVEPPGAIDATDPNDGDNYSAPGTNPFVVTRHDPLSTFAADVDTASYDIFRRDARGGYLPAEASVRLEEYVNGFAYGYEPPAADNTHPFAVHLAAAPGFFGVGTALFRIGVQARLPSLEKPPANLVFLVDVSGSMASEDKLPFVQLILTETLDVLDPKDRVSIVTYSDTALLRLAPTPVANSSAIEQVILELSAGGSTAGADAIGLAYAQAQSGFIEGGLNHVVLCTDGDFNVGPSSPAELVRIIEQKRQTGVTLTALGFGQGNLDDALLEALANAGNGIYSVISSSDQAIEYANERMLGTIEHVAKDLKIQVEFNPERVYAYRLLGYENRAIADDDFRDDTVDAGDVGAGHAVTALYEIVPAGVGIPSPAGAPQAQDGAAHEGTLGATGNDWAVVRVRYKQPGAVESDPAQELAQALRAEDVVGGYDELDADFRWALAVASFAEILKRSPYAWLEELPAIAREVRAPEHGVLDDRAEFVALFDAVESLVSARP